MATPFDSNLSTPEHQIDPPLKTGFIRSMVFAFAIHGLLVAALTWGVNWHQKAETTGVQAELWSAQNQESAPSAMAQNTPTPEQVEPPPPPPQVEPEKKAEPIKSPVKPVEVENEIKDAQIALEKAKKEKLKQEIEQEKKLKEKKEKEKAKAEQLEKEKQAEKNRLEQEKLDKAKAQKEKEKADKADKLAKELKDAKAKADKLASEKARQEQINRLKNQAGATGAESGNTANGIGKNNGNGTATQSSGPSAGYEGRVRARLKPNIVFTENINGNPSTEIEVRLAQDGMVVGKPKILRSSGVKSWDEAAVRAIEKTEIFPRDVDGKVPPIIILTLKPRE